MMAETTTTEETTEEVVPPVEVKKEFTKEETEAYINKIQDENARSRINNKELKENLKAGNDAIEALKKIEDGKLADEGKYKELLDAKDEELAEFKTDKTLLGQYEAVFQKNLDDELKGLGESTIKMINESGKSVVEKLEMTQAIKKEAGLNTNSPGGERPGAASGTKGEDAILKEYNSETDKLKKVKLLKEIRIKMPELYKTI